MKIKKKLTILNLCVFLLCFSVLTACGSGNNNGNQANNTSNNTTSNAAGNTTATKTNDDSAASNLPPVKLTFIYPVAANPGKDQQLVNDKINEYLKKKINATVDLKPFTYDEYEPKLNAMLAANEDFDIAWSSKGWLGNYQPYIDKGAYLQITDDMIKKDAPEARAQIPDKFWPDMKAADGKVYGFPVYQVAAKQKSFVIQKRFIDKYHLDVSKIHSYKDIEPFLKELKDNEPGIIPLGLAQNSHGLYTDPNVIDPDGAAVGYKKDDPNYTLVTKHGEIMKKDIR